MRLAGILAGIGRGAPGALRTTKHLLRSAAWPPGDGFVEEAAALIAERVPVLAGIETVSLVEADGRIAAGGVLAGLDLPPFDNSAVDGYAVRFADLAAGPETVLPVRGRLPAGAAPEGGLAAGALHLHLIAADLAGDGFGEDAAAAVVGADEE